MPAAEAPVTPELSVTATEEYWADDSAELSVAVAPVYVSVAALLFVG